MFRLKKYTKINLTYAWFALIILASLNIMNYADRSIFNALMDPIKSDFKFNDLQLGWLASAFLFVYAIAAYPLARIADKGIRKAVLIPGVLLWSVATFFTGWSHSFFHLFLARSILGIGEASYATTLAPLLTDYFPSAMRSTVLGLANAPLGIGTALGYYVAGLSAMHFGWRHAFFYLGIPGVLLGIVAMFLREPEMGLSDRQEQKEKPNKEIPHQEALKSLFGTKTLRYLWLSQILSTFALGGMLVWIAALLHRHYGFTVADAAIDGGTAAVVGSVLGVCIGGIAADWWGRIAVNGPIWVVILGTALSGVSLTVLFHVTGRMNALYCVGAIAFFQMAINGPFLAAMMNVTFPNIRSTCNAVYLFLIHVFGDASSPPVIGYLSHRMGDLKSALQFLPWVTLLAAIIAGGALFHYGKEKREMLGSL